MNPDSLKMRRAFINEVYSVLVSDVKAFRSWDALRGGCSSTR